ncbi:DUF2142 domain-containing protein [Neoactinobaculum massilliense]|uniref:DUF2142 domain-containing protein n=1 Tax=Neoactinobaculum massilliense TaxID=2364794 RepID=UPI0013DDF39F|nr:DUF2142 domain-containing protein [Neoactinobaculum massilliense]
MLSTTRHRPLFVISLLVGCVLACAAWALSSPAGASPDEPSHVAYAWGTISGQTLRGSRILDEQERVTHTVISMPAELKEYVDPGEYKFQPEQPAGSFMLRDRGEIVTATSYMTGYPPLYYALVGAVLRVGIAVGMGGYHVLVAARICSGLGSMALIYGTWRVLRNRFPVAGIAVPVLLAITPAVAFLASSVNPSGWEITAAMFLAAVIVAIRHDAVNGADVPIRTELCLPLAIIILGLSRPLSAIWVGGLLLLLLLPVKSTDGRRIMPLRVLTRWVRVLAYLAALVVVACFVALAAERVASVTGEPATDWSDTPVPARWMAILLRFGTMLQMAFGVMGWNDTNVPLLFFILWLVVGTWAMSRAAAGATQMILRPRLVALFAGLMLLAVVLESYYAAFGWQGRYAMPIVTASLVLLIPQVSDGVVGPHIRPAISVLVFCVGVHLIAVLWNMVRYAWGESRISGDSQWLSLPIPGPGPATWIPMGGVALVTALAIVEYTLIALGGSCMLRYSRPAAYVSAPTGRHAR